MKYIVVTILVLFLAGCESKKESIEEQNKIENIIIDNAYVVLDNAKVMSQYRDFNQHLLDSFDIDFRTITTTSNDEDIDLFANNEFTRLQKESRSKSGKAILMVINTFQDKVRLEVSMGLEPVYTDAFISYIERKGFVPYFRNDTIADAIYMAAELISDRAYDAQEGKEFMPPMQSKSIGAGAKTKAHIGKVNHSEKRGANVSSVSSDTPMDVLKKYLSTLKEHNTNPNLDIYTNATKQFFKKWTVTKINQNNEIRFLTPCMDSKQVKYASDGMHAVVHNDPTKQRKCTPHFFKKEQDKWKLDIATMAQILRFNAPMDWHFDKKERLKGEAMYYAFAFDGYGLDKNGYPMKYQTNSKWKKYRWKYTCGAYLHPGDRKNDARCWIKYASPGGAADVRLGFEGYDKIYGFGEGVSRKENVTIKELINYLNSLSSGEVATVIIEHYYLNGKETYKFDDILNPNVRVEYEVRKGIAP
jgi:uncharacterized protein